MKLFDAHCHLTDPEPLERAAEAGIVGAAVCATSSKDWKTVLKIADRFPGIGKRNGGKLCLFPMIGIHPWFVSNHWKENFQALEKTVRDFPTLGIGETGLDFSDPFENRIEQEECFAAHLDLARELNRPVAVHCVHAWGRVIDLLRDHPAPRVLLHAFGGAPELIAELAELNGWFSFGATVLNAKKARASVAAVPADRLLVETDSEGDCDQSGRLMAVVSEIAALRGVGEQDLASLTFDNANKFFDLFN